MRLDKYVYEKLDKPSRTYAENLILKGQVSVNGKTVTKPSFSVDEDDKITVINDESYASQGAYKLLEALSSFSISLIGISAVDVGCSNGGFTDVMLRAGAKKVLAIDVGECALPDRLLSDGRVEFLRANARELDESLNSTADFVCCDVSFISQTLILPSIFKLLKAGGTAVTLIKPQFELRKSQLSKDGIVLKEKDRQTAINTVTDCATLCGFTVKGITPSPVFYENKNREYLLYLAKPE